MTAERKHRCGGTLWPRDVQVQDERGGMVLVHVVPGLVCDRCQEELVERETVLIYEKSQTPAAMWFSSSIPASTSGVQAAILPSVSSLVA